MSEEKTAKNKHIYFRNVELDYFLQYALACQTYQGSAYGECFSAASQIHEEEGADAHNQANNLSLLHEVVFDWLDEVYSEG
jgi:hypothetical protein